MWTEDGFGFSLNNTNLRKIIDFITTNLPASESDVSALRGLADAGDICALDALFDAPVSWVVADLINKSEGITLVKGYRDNGYMGQHVGIDPRFVWFMTDKDKEITQPAAEEILRKYFNLFDGKGAIGYFTIYFDSEEQA